MPLVCSNRLRRSTLSLMPKRAARQDVAVGCQAPGRDRAKQFRHVDMGARDRDGGADVDTGGDAIGKGGRHQVAPRVERDDLRRIGPLRMRTDGLGRRGIGEIGPVVALQPPRRHGQRTVDRVCP
jgi:hypothetical protein